MGTTRAWRVWDFPEFLAPFPSLTISPVLREHLKTVSGCDSSRGSCHSCQAQESSDSSGPRCMQEKSRRQISSLYGAAQGEPAKGMSALPSRTLYVESPGRCLSRHPENYRAWAAPSLEPEMSQNAQRINQRQSFNWPWVLLFFLAFIVNICCSKSFVWCSRVSHPNVS